MKRKLFNDIPPSFDAAAAVPENSLSPSWVWLITDLGSIYAIDINQRNPPGTIRALDRLVCQLNDFYPEVGMGMISSGNKFYMLGGIKAATYSKPCADVYICDTSLIVNPTSYAYPKDLFRKGPSMHAPKVNPIVISMSSKIYVLAYTFHPLSQEDVRSCPSPRFEAFDPENESWCILAEPDILPGDETMVVHYDKPHSSENWPFTEAYRIESYLVSGSDLIVSTRHRGLFQYNTETDTWKHIISWGGLKGLPFNRLPSHYVDGTWYGWCSSGVGAFEVNDKDGCLIEKDSIGDFDDFDTDVFELPREEVLSHLSGQTMCYVLSGRPPTCEECSPPSNMFVIVNVFEAGKQPSSKERKQRSTYFRKKSSDAYLMVDAKIELESVRACIQIS